MLDRVEPSATVGGASKETGPSSSVNGEARTGLSSSGDAAVTEEEPGEVGGNAGGNNRKPGLFGEGCGEGERAREA